MKSSPNQITTYNARWRTQFRFAGNVFWSGVCAFRRWTEIDYSNQYVPVLL